MAFVTIPSINTGDEIKVENFNDFITSVNAVTSSINAENIRDEGIDRRNLATNSVQEIRVGSDLFKDSGDTFQVAGSTTSFVPINSTTTGLPIKVGVVNSKDDEFIMVNCSFSFTANNPKTFVETDNRGGQEVEFKLQYKDYVSGVVADIGGTKRAFNSFMSMHGNYHANLRYSCTIVAAFIPDSTTTGLHEIEVNLLGMDHYSNSNYPLGNCVVHDVTMFARVIKR